jgi:hypothetical protein
MTALVEIELLAQDTLGSLLASLRGVGPGRVLFAVPPGLRLSVVELRALAHEGARSGQRIALLTRDASLRRDAARAGLSSFGSRSWAARAPWAAVPAQVSRRSAPPTPASTLPPPLASGFDPRSPSGFEAKAFDRSFKRRRSTWWSVLGLSAILVALVAVSLVLLSLVVPEAIVTLVPGSEPISTTVQLTAVRDARVDEAAGIVPAQVLSAQVSGEARTSTTGRRPEPAGKARGSVILINRTARPVLVPAGTAVSTATGQTVQFVTLRDAPLEPNGRTPVEAEALLPGPDGNARAGTITRVEGPLGLSVMVANPGGFSGGSTAPMPYVTEEDQQRLQAQLFEELKKGAVVRLNERLEPGMFIPPESVTYLAMSPTFAPFVGEVADELFLSMSVQAIGSMVDARSGNGSARNRLLQMMPPGSRLISDTLRFQPSNVRVNDAGTMVFEVNADGTLLRGPDSDAVRELIKGMTPAEAVAALQARYRLSEAPQVRLGPDWLPGIVPTHLPVIPWRIRVLVDWDAGADAATKATVGLR